MSKGRTFTTQLAAKWMVEQVNVRGPSDRPKTAAQAAAASGVYNPKIITISSVSAYTASTNRGDYCVSKAALSMLTPLFATRLATRSEFQIRPGMVHGHDRSGEGAIRQTHR